jgi:hypothetical protein
MLFLWSIYVPCDGQCKERMTDAESVWRLIAWCVLSVRWGLINDDLTIPCPPQPSDSHDNRPSLITTSDCRILSTPPLWSCGQSSCLQIQRSKFDSRLYQIFWQVVGLEQGPLSLVTTTEILERKSGGSDLENRDYDHRGSAALTTRHPSIHKSWH